MVVAGVVAVLIITVGSAFSVWRYDEASRRADAALSSKADALHAQEVVSLLWREREAMNEYLLDPSPEILAEVARHRQQFDAAVTALAAKRGESDPVYLARRANSRLVRAFDERRRGAIGTHAQRLAAVAVLNSIEKDVVEPLSFVQQTYLGEVEQNTSARNAASTQAFVTSIFAGLVAVIAAGGLAVYAGRLLSRSHEHRAVEETANAEHLEFSELLQGVDGEEEADDLLKRQLERSIAGSDVIVLRRNNSDDQIMTLMEPDASLAERLAGARPRACLAIRSGRMYTSDQSGTDLVRCAVCAEDTGCTTCEPLLVGGEVIGATLIRHPDPLSLADKRTVVNAVGLAGPVLWNLRNLELARIRASTDALTGLANSREAQDTLRRMVAHASRTMSPLAALMLDLDHFKQINDTYGHALGDDVLAAVGDTLVTSIRASDFAARYGGEEFIILLPDTGRHEAELVAEKIRVAVTTVSVAGIGRDITASIGLAVYPDDAADGVSLLRHADRALYSAKEHGRNRVVSIGTAAALSET